MKKRTLVIGDIHGGYKALMQCLSRSSFNYKSDTLIVLGDVADGWNQVPECIEELNQINHLVLIWGNHDYWLNRWLNSGWTHPVWTTQGGQATLDAYRNQTHYLVKHRNFFDVAKPYYIVDDKLFVHGGLYPINLPVQKQELNVLMWDRELFSVARWKHYKKPDYKYGGFDDIFIGHTSTHGMKNDEPIHYCNVWNLDQGAGWSGKLTIMNVDTKEYWQSDNVLTLYPYAKGRR